MRARRISMLGYRNIGRLTLLKNMKSSFLIYLARLNRYLYQAKCPPLEGEDDCSEGIGWSPEEAVKDLLYNIKKDDRRTKEENS